MYWNEYVETMKIDEMVGLQTVALKNAVRYAYDHVEFYRLRFDDHQLNPDDIQTIDDISQLPFMSKTDLLDQYPYGLCAVPLSEIRRLHASSGTTGQPTPVFNTPTDMENWAECMARNLFMAGVRKDDIARSPFATHFSPVHLVTIWGRKKSVQ